MHARDNVVFISEKAQLEALLSLAPVPLIRETERFCHHS